MQMAKMMVSKRHMTTLTLTRKFCYICTKKEEKMLRTLAWAGTLSKKCSTVQMNILNFIFGI